MAVLYREVALIQKYTCTQLYVVRTADSVLIREESFIQRVLYREVPLYTATFFIPGTDTESDNLCGAPTTVSLRVVEETEDCIDAIRHSRHTVALKQ